MLCIVEVVRCLSFCYWIFVLLFVGVVVGVWLLCVDVFVCGLSVVVLLLLVS